jgi:hypothetical protein
MATVEVGPDVCQLARGIRLRISGGKHSATSTSRPAGDQIIVREEDHIPGRIIQHPQWIYYDLTTD